MNEREMALLAKCGELEHSLSDAMEQIEAIQSSNAVHMAKVEALKLKVAELEGELHVARHCIDVDAKAIQDCVELQTQLDRDLSRARVAATVDVASTGEAFDILERAMVDLTREKSEAMAQLDRANASKLRIQRDSDRESKCERDESEYQCDACARCFQRVSEQLERATSDAKSFVDKVCDMVGVPEGGCEAGACIALESVIYRAEHYEARNKELEPEMVRRGGLIHEEGTRAAELQRQLDLATSHAACLELANESLQEHRDHLKLLRDYLRQEYGRPAYAEIEDNNDGPATFAINMMNSERRENLANTPKPCEPRPMSEAPLDDDSNENPMSMGWLPTADGEPAFRYGQAVTFKHHGAGPLYGHVAMRGDSLVVVDKFGEWARLDSLTDVRATTTTADGGSGEGE